METITLQAKCISCRAGIEKHEDGNGTIKANRIWVEVPKNKIMLLGWIHGKECPQCEKKMLFKVK